MKMRRSSPMEMFPNTDISEMIISTILIFLCFATGIQIGEIIKNY